MDDFAAYSLYPKDNWVYDKREIADLYNVKYFKVIPTNEKFCVKPFKNLFGCSVNSQIVDNLKGFNTPSECLAFEYLEGIHWTADYEYTELHGWVSKNVYIGEKFENNHQRFKHWYAIKPNLTFDNFSYFKIPKFLEYIIQTPIVNVEYIGNKAIEVHLRGNTDPVGWDEIIPVWDTYPINFPQGYQYFDDKENHPGRVGFFVKNYESNL